MLGRGQPWLLAMMVIDAVATGGCGSPDICARRPWECETGGTGETEATESSGSCDAYVPPSFSSLTDVSGCMVTSGAGTPAVSAKSAEPEVR